MVFYYVVLIMLSHCACPSAITSIVLSIHLLSTKFTNTCVATIRVMLLNLSPSFLYCQSAMTSIVLLCYCLTCYQLSSQTLVCHRFELCKPSIAVILFHCSILSLAINPVLKHMYNFCLIWSYWYWIKYKNVQTSSHIQRFELGEELLYS